MTSEGMLRKSLLSRLIVLCLLGAGAGPMNAQNVSVWLTTDDQKTLMQPQSLVSFSAGASATASTIFVSDDQAFQSIEGFGASMTDSAAFLLNEKVPSAALDDVMTSLFDRTRGIGISFLRNPMGASDLARYDYSYDDIPAGSTDSGLVGFSIAHDQTDILPLLRQARTINPQIKLVGSPWSPPGWMKTTGSMIGGSLLPSSYTAFAGYLEVCAGLRGRRRAR